MITFSAEGIKMPKNKNHEAIYNLNGQRLNKIHKGINIVDGKKIMVK